MFENKVAYPNQYHDSVTGDCSIYWKEGDELRFGTMDELFLVYNTSDKKSVFKILSARAGPNPNRVMSAQNIEICFSDIGGMVYHGIRPVWRMTLHNGKTIGITRGHSIFYSKAYDSQLKATALFDLESNDRVVSIDEYNINIQSMSDYDNDFLTFMGLWMADGSYYKTYGKNHPQGRLYGVNISTGSNLNVIKWLTVFASRYPPQFGYRNGEQELLSVSKKGDLCLVRKNLAYNIFSLFGEVDSYTKRVPRFIFTENHERIAAFLRGYFTGDGCIWYRKGRGYYEITCASVNRELLTDVSVLLHRLGIKHIISEPMKSGPSAYATKRLYYKLFIGDEHSKEKFINYVGFIKAHSYNKRANFVGKYCCKGLRPVSLRGIRKLEYVGERTVYDISVPETEAFIANGFLCLETQIWQNE